MPAPRLPSLPNLANLASLTRHLEFRAVSRWVGFGLVVGLLSGCAAILLYLAVDAVGHACQWATGWERPRPAGEPSLFAHHSPASPRTWLIVLTPALGGLLCGLIIRHLCAEARGGNDEWITAFHHGRGRSRRRVVLAKLCASSLFLGSGASAGREGPIAHIGAALGALVGRSFRLSDRERRLLLIAGAAGGIGAIFRTPLGGALFAVEVLYRDDLEVDALVPAVLSSVVAYSLFTSVFGETTLFETVNTYHFDPRELPLYLVMAVGAALAGFVLITLCQRVERIANAWKIYSPIKPAVGGLLVGVLALLMPQALGTGYGWLQEVLHPEGAFSTRHGVWLLLAAVGVKIVATAVSTGSGGAGGRFGPSVVLGGMVGGIFGQLFHSWFPTVVTDPTAFALVGMACFVGGVTHAPLSTLVMASEMTGSYELLVPVMFAQVLTFALLGRWTLYSAQMATRRDSPAHGGEYVLDVLQDIRVAEVLTPDDVVTVEARTPIKKLLQQCSESSQAVFPVVAGEGGYDGIVTLETMRGFFYDEDIGVLAIAADCAQPFVCVTPDDSLAVALARFAESHYQQLPVVDPAHESVLIGLLSYEQVLEAYSQELVRRRASESQFPSSSPPSAS